MSEIVDQDLRRQRQRAAELRVDVLELGMMNSSIAVDDQRARATATTTGYVIADFTLRRSSTCFSIVSASRMQHAVEHTAGLTGRAPSRCRGG